MTPISRLRSHAVRLGLAVAVASLGSIGCAPTTTEPTLDHRVELTDGWRLRASADVEAGGDAISTSGFDTAGWTPAVVPTTVIAALIADGQFTDVFFDRNLEAISTEPFEGSWWYRHEVDLGDPGDGTGRRLDFDGINYRADIWLNGRLLASADEVLGAFRRFSFDITDRVVDGPDSLAVEVHPPRPGDFTVGFVDWNPTPPDRNMGIFRNVTLRTTQAVTVDDVFVQPSVDLETLASATATISARLTNRTDSAVDGELVAAVDGREVRQAFSLAAGEERSITLSPTDHPALVFEQPRLWWPHDLGEPALYDLELSAEVDGRTSDATSTRFGLRAVSDFITPDGYRGYRVNGRDVLIRGGGWVDDIFLVEDPRKVESQVLYAKHMHLNTLRLEGFWGNTELLYDLADEHGLLVMAGWSCQWEWEEYLGTEVDEFGGIDTPEEIDLVAKSLVDQVTWLRNHPSLFVWVLASDMLPRPALESRYRADMADLDPTRPLLAACAVADSEVSGPTGVKMNGPYDYVTPNYWYVDRERGGAYGFNTETGPGPQPPPLESLRRMIPDDHLWPIDEVWEYHCGRHEFNTLDRYAHALSERYGESDGAEAFLRKAQAANYEAMRAMYEAFTVNRPTTTGIVQWMLNSAWPELYWQLYDYYLMPNGAFYGARHANKPANLVYHYGDGGIYAVANSPDPLSGLQARIRVLDHRSQVVRDETLAVELIDGSATRLTGIDKPEGAPVYFVDLRLETGDASIVGRNFYWLSSEDDVLDPDASTWFVTPNSAYADLTALESLPATEVEIASSWQPGERSAEVTLSNTGDHIAFFIELRLVDPATDTSLLPVLWDDNYISLLPGEERTVGARFLDPLDADTALAWSGWNVASGGTASHDTASTAAAPSTDTTD